MRYILLLHLRGKKIKMTKSIQILSLVTISAMAFGQGIQFEKTTFNDILGKAKKENKLIFLDAYASWCGPCKLMDKNIFPLKSVGDFYNGNFVNAKIDMEKGEGVALAKKYGVSAYPTYLFIDGDGKEVHRTLGYVEENDFLQFAKDAMDPSKRIGALQKEYENGKKDLVFLKKLAEMTMFSDATFSGRVLDTYFTEKKKQNLDLEKEDVTILMMAARSANPKALETFGKHQEALTKVLGEKSYTNFYNGQKVNAAINKAYNKETKTFDEGLFYTETASILSKEEAAKAITKAKASRALKAKDFATYEKLILESYQDFSKASANELNSAAWNFYENVTNKTSLEKAVTWALQSIKLSENFANTDTLAHLYSKLGDKTNAKLWAEKSVSLAKAAGQEADSSEKLLESLK